MMRLNFTTYDVKRAQDTINPSTSHCDIMLPASARPSIQDVEDTFATDQHSNSTYAYARVLGIYHANVISVGRGSIDSSPRRMDFLWVRWYHLLPATEPFRMDKVEFPPISEPNATSFVDPTIVIRACHLIPDFAQGKRFANSTDHGSSKLAQDRNDWKEYYVNQYV
jgi:hypothetical protein